MAKYSITDTTLTAIADAIREKAGNSDAMTPAQMAEMIAAIDAGPGGGPAELIATGTITPSEDIEFDKSTAISDQPLEIIHNAGIIPRAAFIYLKSGTESSTYLSTYVEIYKGYDGQYCRSEILLARKASSSYFYVTRGLNSSTLKDYVWTDTKVYLGSNNTTSKLKAGYTYEWFVYI